MRQSAAAIAATQEPSGAIPWFAAGQTDPWDHVEAAMALLVCGEVEAAERGYDWMFERQRPDGSWPSKVTGGVVVDAGADTNMAAYVAVGIWHHWLVRRDRSFVEASWPVVRRGLDFVVDMQLPFGGVRWARDAAGGLADTALLSGSASIHQALRCGLALSELLDDAQPDWEIAVGRLGHALREHEDEFEDKRRFAMDWYYPVLAGAVRGDAAVRRIRERWSDFVVPGLGILCVDDHPWVTGAETCELVLALDTIGERNLAVSLLSDMQHLRDADGSYWTGYVFADGLRWPVERSTWTAAAVILAVDALSSTTGGADVFRGVGLPAGLAEIGLECGCPSADRVTGVTAGSG